MLSSKYTESNSQPAPESRRSESGLLVIELFRKELLASERLSVAGQEGGRWGVGVGDRHPHPPTRKEK